MELVIRDLSKTYANGVHALKNVSLTIPQGMFGLLGPNGAGKSTLMRTLATLQEADSGSVTLGTIDVLAQNVSQIEDFVGPASNAILIVLAIGYFWRLWTHRHPSE